MHLDRDEVLSRDEIVLSEDNYPYFTSEGRHPDNIFTDDYGVEWRAVRERQMPFKQQVVTKYRNSNRID
jgi:hypothetical protein